MHHEQLYEILPIIISCVNLCDHTKTEFLTIMKCLYQYVWNCSLKCSLPDVALTLQKHSLFFLMWTGTDTSKFVDLSIKSAQSYLQKTRNFSFVELYYKDTIENMKKFVLSKSSIDKYVLVQLFNCMVELATTLIKTGNSGEFSKFYRPLITEIEPTSSMTGIFATKLGIKILDAAMSCSLGKCDDQIFVKIVCATSQVPNEPTANTILVNALLHAFTILQSNCSDKSKVCRGNILV